DFSDQPSAFLHLDFGPDIGHRGRLACASGWRGSLVADNVAHIEFQPPAILSVFGDAVEFQCANFGGAGSERDRDALRAAALAATEDGVQRRQLQQLIWRDLEHVARVVVASHGRRVQGKSDRLSQREFQLRLFERDFLAFFEMLWDNAEDSDTVPTPSGGAPWGCFDLRFNSNVLRACAASADAPTAGVSQPTVVGGSPRDGEIKRGICQNERLPRLSGNIVPAVHDFKEAVAERGGLENAPVKQYGGWDSSRAFASAFACA